ncbi:hypothetical protein I4U23_023005 [Adineta vaga]|nr:hypothetical protein I4U23_023005 [Adineta vaga]
MTNMVTNNTLPKDWWQPSVVYQIYPRSFYDSNNDGIGDINGITLKLDYLKNLGIDIIWLSPVYDSPNYDNGYDIRDYFKIMTDFGTMNDFDQMLSEMKRRKLKLVMDLVVNHTSDEHPWFIESKKSKDNPYRDFYHWAPGKDGKAPNQWGACFGGPAWTYDILTGEYYLHTFTPKQPDLKWENPVVRQEVYKIIRWWLDKGVDGLRMDVINFISKAPGYPEGKMHPNAQYSNGSPYFVNRPQVHEFLQEMHEQVLRHYNIVTIGECPGASITDAQLFSCPQRRELDMIFTFEHMSLDGGRRDTFLFLLNTKISSKDKWIPKSLVLHDLKKNFTRWQKNLYNKGWNSLYWNNHDQPRIVSRFGNDSSIYRVVSAKMLATCLHFLSGTPYIYQGEEIGMTNVRFPSIADYRDVETLNFHRSAIANDLSLEVIMAAVYTKSRDNARTPMQWSGSLPYGGFSNGTTKVKPWIGVNPNFKDINVEDTLNDPQSIYYYYQKLIHLRRTMPLIVYGKYDILHDEHKQIFMYRRYDEHLDNEIIVACNFSQQPMKTDNAQLAERLNKYGQLLISNYHETNDSNYLNFRSYEAWAIEVKQS